jgi:hypothetical protein
MKRKTHDNINQVYLRGFRGPLPTPLGCGLFTSATAETGAIGSRKGGETLRAALEAISE